MNYCLDYRGYGLCVPAVWDANYYFGPPFYWATPGLNPAAAYGAIRAAMAADPIYAATWHDNLAMAIHDEIEAMKERQLPLDAREVGNRAASRLMRYCFGVTTVKPEER